ncbi:glycosyltransferase [Pedobacter sp. Leaf132]|uniref:glycosyltransferase n=1 Tax=Pedobacter sp. Leaf132 TaxID=2876557 RepID=UPI001E42A87F|nr:glycosyltransferase [Pedobacter sp. Leaf132]
MISIIISSTDPHFLENVTKNITETIGVPFEIISFENGEGKKGLCELYNSGAKVAKYELLCFMHEDVNIKTHGWGEIVNQAFIANTKLGLLGIAGSVYKALSPSGWHSNSENTERSNIIQTFKFSDKTKLHHTRNPDEEEFTKVACVDGVWFCALKKIVFENPFDEEIFKGFHAYDIDFSLQVGKKYEINVRYDILLQHFSEGNFNRSWLNEIIKLHQKWSIFLPITTVDLDNKTLQGIEKRTFKDFINKALFYGISKRQLFKVLWIKNGIRRYNFALFLKLNRYLIRKVSSS